MGQTDSRVIGSELQQVTAPRLRASAQAYPETQKKIVLEVASDIEDLGRKLEVLGTTPSKPTPVVKTVATKKITLNELDRPHLKTIEAQKASIQVHKTAADVKDAKDESVRLSSEAASALKKAKDASDKGDTELAKKLSEEATDLQGQSKKKSDEVAKLKNQLTDELKMAGAKYDAAADANDEVVKVHEEEVKNLDGAAKEMIMTVIAGHKTVAKGQKLFAKFYRDKARATAEAD